MLMHQSTSVDRRITSKGTLSRHQSHKIVPNLDNLVFPHHESPQHIMSSMHSSPHQPNCSTYIDIVIPLMRAAQTTGRDMVEYDTNETNEHRVMMQHIPIFALSLMETVARLDQRGIPRSAKITSRKRQQASAKKSKATPTMRRKRQINNANACLCRSLVYRLSNLAPTHIKTPEKSQKSMSFYRIPSHIP